MAQRQRALPLYRSDIRQRHDRLTNSITLQYVGRRNLDWHDRVYGYDDGTFFVINIDEIGYPENLVDLADELGLDIDQLPDSRRLREAASVALAAEGMVNAPELISGLALQEMAWNPWDRRDLERKHVVAVARLVETTRIMASEMRRRCAPMCEPEPEPETVSPLLPSAGIEYLSIPTAGSVYTSPPTASEVPTTTVDLAATGEDEGPEVSSSVVQRVRFAIQAAREAELPQRLPQGARRRLKQMPPGSYLAYGEALDSRVDVCGAMADGRSLGRKGREVVLIEWDGEWPVVARRWGQGGRTIYKVEDALRRQGVEIKEAS